jgi:hypothetical protein
MAVPFGILQVLDNTTIDEIRCVEPLSSNSQFAYCSIKDSESPKMGCLSIWKTVSLSVSRQYFQCDEELSRCFEAT